MQPTPFFPQAIDSTMRSDFLRCPHSFFRRYCQGLRSKRETNVHLHFGGAVAHGLERVRRDWCAGKSEDDAILSGCRAAIKFWGDFTPDDAPGTAQRKTLPALLDAIFSYFIEHPLSSDPFTIARLGDKPLIEWSGAAPIPGTRHPVTGDPILYAGRFDWVAQLRTGTQLWIIDEKTASALGDAWRNQWNLRGQPTGYCWLMRQYGVRVEGAIMRGIGIMTNTITFAESHQPRAPWQLAQWQEQLTRDVNLMRDYWLKYTDVHYNEASNDDREGIWPRALDKACFDYNHPCQFTPLCASRTPNNWLGDFKIEHWEPLREREHNA